MSYELEIFGETVEVSVSSVDANLDEMSNIFEEREPYTLADTITGIEYVWNSSFIDKVVFAMSTDNLGPMDFQEREIWDAFQLYQEYHATFPLGTEGETEGHVGFIGCTVPSGEFAYDETGNSYAVLGDGTVTEILCQSPTNPVGQVELMASFDAVLMNLYNCEDYNPEALYEGELIDVQPCTI